MTWLTVLGFLKKALPYIIGAAIVAAVVIWYNVQISAAEKRGAATVQAQWDADKARRIELTTGIALLYAKALEKHDADLHAQEQQAEQKYAAFQKRIDALSHTPTIYLSPDTVGVLDDIFRSPGASTTPGSAAGTQAGADPVSTAAQGGYISQADVAQMYRDGKKSYDDAVLLLHQCWAFYSDVQQPTKGMK